MVSSLLGGVGSARETLMSNSTVAVAAPSVFSFFAAASFWESLICALTFCRGFCDIDSDCDLYCDFVLVLLEFLLAVLSVSEA